MQMKGSIKDRNGMDLTEADDIKKKCQEYTEELYKKDLWVTESLKAPSVYMFLPFLSLQLCYSSE